MTLANIWTNHGQINELINFIIRQILELLLILNDLIDLRLSNYILLILSLALIESMKQRINIALADIKYIQTEVQKILNKSAKNSLEVSPFYSKKDFKSHTPIQTKTVRQSPDKAKQQIGQDNKKTTNAKGKEKSPSLAKTAKKQQTSSSNKKIIQSKGSFVVAKNQRQKKQSVSIQRNIKQPTINVSIPVEEKSATKKLFMEWSIRERSNPSLSNDKNKLETPKEPGPKLQVFASERLQNKKQNKMNDSKPLAQSKVDSLPYLTRNNQIPLRSDQDYLIKKYHYQQKNSQKKSQLKQKYKLLDQRLDRLKIEIRRREQHPEESEKSKKSIDKLKKQALGQYYRYSPLNKLVRINDKLKKEYGRSKYSQWHHTRHTTSQDDNKPKWTH